MEVQEKHGYGDDQVVCINSWGRTTWNCVFPWAMSTLFLFATECTRKGFSYSALWEAIFLALLDSFHAFHFLDDSS